MPSLVEIGPVVQEKKIYFNFVNVFLLFRIYLPLEKGDTYHLKNLNFLYQGCFVSSLVEICRAVLGKRMKM